MASEIELALYGELAKSVSQEGHVGEHVIVEFSIRRDITSDCSDIIRIAVTPEIHEYESPKIATFMNAHLGSVRQENHDPEYNFLPWGIVGFHSTDCGNNEWSFKLNCDSIRLEWSSCWPEIQVHA